MYKVINQYMSKISLQSGEEVRKWLCEQVKTVKTIKLFSVAERAKQFVIDMKLEAFSVEEAAQYFRIGENKIRQMIAQTPYANWILRNGNRVQIKRILFEQFIDSLEAV